MGKYGSPAGLSEGTHPSECSESLLTRKHGQPQAKTELEVSTLTREQSFEPLSDDRSCHSPGGSSCGTRSPSMNSRFSPHRRNSKQSPNLHRRHSSSLGSIDDETLQGLSTCFSPTPPSISPLSPPFLSQKRLSPRERNTIRSPVALENLQGLRNDARVAVSPPKHSLRIFHSKSKSVGDLGFLDAQKSRIIRDEKNDCAAEMDKNNSQVLSQYPVEAYKGALDKSNPDNDFKTVSKGTMYGDYVEKVNDFQRSKTVACETPNPPKCLHQRRTSITDTPTSPILEEDALKYTSQHGSPRGGLRRMTILAHAFEEAHRRGDPITQMYETGKMKDDQALRKKESDLPEHHTENKPAGGGPTRSRLSLRRTQTDPTKHRDEEYHPAASTSDPYSADNFNFASRPFSPVPYTHHSRGSSMNMQSQAQAREIQSQHRRGSDSAAVLAGPVDFTNFGSLHQKPAAASSRNQESRPHSAQSQFFPEHPAPIKHDLVADIRQMRFDVLPSNLDANPFPLWQNVKKETAQRPKSFSIPSTIRHRRGSCPSVSFASKGEEPELTRSTSPERPSCSADQMSLSARVKQYTGNDKVSNVQHRLLGKLNRVRDKACNIKQEIMPIEHGACKFREIEDDRHYGQSSATVAMMKQQPPVLNESISGTPMANLMGAEFKYDSDHEHQRNNSVQPNHEVPTDWAIVEPLGKGTYGRVYRAVDKNTGKSFAVKQIKWFEHGYSNDNHEMEEHIMKLQQEISVMRNLDHPNIVLYLGSELDHESQTLNIFLELISGGSILSQLKNMGCMREGLVKKYTKHIVQGTAYLHGKNIIHRDIKAANVLITKKGVAVLADFGCSKQFQGMETTKLDESLKQIRGTVLWMAPEVLLQDGHGRKADIWSIGCTVLEMFTGKQPWPEFKNRFQAMYHIATSGQTPPIPETVSEEAKDFLNKCFKINPKERWSAKHLLSHPFLTKNL